MFFLITDKLIDFDFIKCVIVLTLTASSDSTRICPVGLGCCNKSIENGMKNQVRKKLISLIHTENEGVKSKFKTIYDDLKGTTIKDKLCYKHFVRI